MHCFVDAERFDHEKNAHTTAVALRAGHVRLSITATCTFLTAPSSTTTDESPLGAISAATILSPSGRVQRSHHRSLSDRTRTDTGAQAVLIARRPSSPAAILFFSPPARWARGFPDGLTLYVLSDAFDPPQTPSRLLNYPLPSPQLFRERGSVNARNAIARRSSWWADHQVSLVPHDRTAPSGAWWAAMTEGIS
jgi:hypothetical protein